MHISGPAYQWTQHRFHLNWSNMVQNVNAHRPLNNYALCRPLGGGPRLDRRARIQFGQIHFGVFLTSRLVQKRDVTNREIQLTSFDPKNVTLPTGRSNWPPLVQKRDRYQQGGPTDLLWCKKRDRYQQGDPTDLLWCKNVTSLTGGSWPFRCLDFDVRTFLFIRPESDHWQCLTLTHSLTDYLTDSVMFSKLDWCAPGVWRCLLKSCWGCYCCWC